MKASEKFYRDLETLKDNHSNDTCTAKRFNNKKLAAQIISTYPTTYH